MVLKEDKSQDEGKGGSHNDNELAIVTVLKMRIVKMGGNLSDTIVYALFAFAPMMMLMVMKMNRRMYR